MASVFFISNTSLKAIRSAIKKVWENSLVSFSCLDKARAIYTGRVKIYYGIWWLKKELSMVHLDNSLLPIQKCHLIVCLNELKVCELSQNPKSNSCWKFQLSILTNKKVLFLKEFEVYHVPWIILFSATRCRNIS